MTAFRAALTIVSLLFVLSSTEAGNFDRFKSTKSNKSNLRRNGGANVNDQSTTDQARAWLAFYNSTAESAFFDDTSAQWTYNTNITDYNLFLSNQADSKLAVFQQQAADVSSTYDQSAIDDYATKRLLKKLSTVGIKLDADDTFALSALIGNMTGVFSTATICSMNSAHQQDCSRRWSLDPDLESIMATSTDYELLQYVWQAWRDASGRPIRDTYEQFVELSNKGAKADGFEDTGDWWRSWYEDADFQKDIEQLWYQVLPLYEQLYAYVRKTLRVRVYGDQLNGVNVLPAHILGDMWAQEWTNIFNITMPYPNEPSVDVTRAMQQQGYDARRMFRTADQFFQSLGLIGMTDAFYRDSLMEKPSDREVVCHASSWDFYDRQDFRIKMCTSVNMEDLITIHHEMGHIEYYMQYKDQPITFRDGANPGFHEAIGDTIALSVAIPAHLQTIGLLPDYQANQKEDINFLYKMALEKIAFLPFGYLIDLWRWQAFDGSLTEKTWNDGWWDLRYKYQGLKPPVARDGAKDFDPGSKFHVPANMPYIRYFVARILQFEFYQEMCAAANWTGALHECDFYQNTAAGEALAKVLRMGSSRPWQDVLETMTGQRSMSAQPLIDYFNPLMIWLNDQNKGECFGWGYDEWPEEVMRTLNSNRCPKDAPPEDPVEEFLTQYNEAAADQYNQFVWAEWKYWLNITDANQKAMDDASVKKDQFDQQQLQAVRALDTSQVSDPLTKRQLDKIGAVSLSFTDEQSQTYHGYVSQMSTIYSTAYVCNQSTPNCADSDDPTQKWAFDPTLTNIIAHSRDYELLKYAWKGWRDATGAKMVELYQNYSSLGNAGARAAGFADMAESWRAPYEDAHFEQECEDLWRQILPLYEQLHAYMRRQLLTKFYANQFNTSAIPAHILGDMWAQDWSNLFDSTAPYPDQPSVDVTQAMNDQGYDQKRMFQTAEDFFHSIGLFKMTDQFWNDSMLKKPDDPKRNVDCWADSEEFYNNKDYGIKICAQVDMSDLIVIHHEMGHIQYFMSYELQPVKFHDGANPGFHEAIGDTIALSVSTPGHLQKIGLLTGYDPDSDEAKKQNINYLYKTALDKIAFLPFGYLIDQFRWKVFDTSIPPNKMNDGWWTARKQYQGIVPPVPRSNDDFDAGAKYHVAADIPYIAYFVSHILQFQFHRSLCQAAGHTGPLYTCDIYNSTDAGTLLKNMLTLGSSEPWPEALEQMCGTRLMDASGVMEFFGDLIDWLKKENEANDECYGWGHEWPDYYELPQPRCGKYVRQPDVSSTTAGPDITTSGTAISTEQSTTGTTKAAAGLKPSSIWNLAFLWIGLIMCVRANLR